MRHKLSYLVYKIILFIVRLVFPKMKVVGKENIPDGPYIAVGNHAKMNGPIASELYFPGARAIWTNREMMHVKEVPNYAYKDFWGDKPWFTKWFFRIASYIIAPFASCIFNNAHCIAVNHDRRIIQTFRDTMDALEEGKGVIIFPEHNEEYNNIVWQFAEGFVDVAKMYYKKTGKKIKFLPMYTAPALKTMYIGKPLEFDPEKPFEEERTHICHEMMDRITDIAVSLPEHRIVPYPNVLKIDYPTNKDVGKTLRESGRRIRIPEPVVDYRQFRLSRINEPRFSHVKLLGGWLVYFALYFITENLIPVEQCHVIHCALDDIIPFNEYFLIFYCYWYVLLVASLAYFFFYDVESFKCLQKYIMVTQAAAMVIYIVYPSVQLLRPDTMPNDNFFCQVLSFIYAFDTPTGVCPSLHVAYSMGIASVWTKRKDTSPAFKTFIVLSAVMISISVTFVKQHSAMDVAAAIPVCLLAELLVYGKYRPGYQKRMKKRMEGSSL